MWFPLGVKDGDGEDEGSARAGRPRRETAWKVPRGSQGRGRRVLFWEPWGVGQLRFGHP